MVCPKVSEGDREGCWLEIVRCLAPFGGGQSRAVDVRAGLLDGFLERLVDRRQNGEFTGLLAKADGNSFVRERDGHVVVVLLLFGSLFGFFHDAGDDALQVVVAEPLEGDLAFLLGECTHRALPEGRLRQKLFDRRQVAAVVHFIPYLGVVWTRVYLL